MIARYLQQRIREHAATPAARARSRRVVLLVALIAILSVGDLIATLTFLRSIGMQEINPLAAFIIQNQSETGLILFKFGSVVCCVSLILLIRHFRQGEVAAWIAAIILVGLTVHWHTYTHHVVQLQDAEAITEAQQHGQWHKLHRPVDR